MVPPTSIPPELAGGVLHISLANLKANYRALARKAGKAECGAAVKADCYGIGMAEGAPALWDAGCRTFFVARPAEGATLRALLPEASIYVLDGLMPGQAEFYVRHQLRPALTSLASAQEWAGAAHGAPCALHVDTGINRLGLSTSEFKAFLADDSIRKQVSVSLLMSHLACSDSPAHPLNERQRKRFAELRKLLPDVPASLSNSSGIYLGKSYHHDLVRPGIALYGGNPVAPRKNPMKPVALLQLRVMQLRDLKKGETVGYSATWKAPKDSRIALLAGGYADGVPRGLSSRQADGPAQVWMGGRRCPVVGRVSMDMLAVDVTSLRPSAQKAAQFGELFGHHIPVDEAASWANTISYEVLTRMGRRYARDYGNGES